MFSKHRVLSASVVALGAVALVAAAPAPRFDDGYTVTMKVSGDQMQQGPLTMTFKVMGDKLRLETDMSQLAGRGGGGRGAEMAAGAYMLLQADGKFAMILPAAGMGMTMDVAGMFGGRGRGGMGGTPAVTDLSVSVEDLGAGESMLGHSTHKYRVHTKFTQNTNMMGQATTANHDDSSDLWMTTDFPGAEEAFARLGSTFGSRGGSEVSDAVRSKLPKGVPLKIVATVKTERDNTVTTMETTEIKKTAFQASDFEVPSGIQIMDLGAMGRGRGGF